MRKMLRGSMVALVLVAVTLLVAAPAAAAPSADRSPDGSVGAFPLFHELVTALTGWLDGWVDENAMQHIAARGGPSMDPNGSNQASPTDDGTVSAQGGPSMDPNG